MKGDCIMNKFIVFALILILVFSCTCMAFAEHAVEIGEPYMSEELQETIKSYETGEFIGADQKVDINQLGNKLQAKGYQIVDIFASIGRVLCIGVFVACCIAILFAVFSKGPVLGRFIIGALISGLCFIALTYPAQIMAFFRDFMLS